MLRLHTHSATPLRALKLTTASSRMHTLPRRAQRPTYAPKSCYGFSQPFSTVSSRGIPRFMHRPWQDASDEFKPPRSVLIVNKLRTKPVVDAIDALLSYVGCCSCYFSPLRRVPGI